MLAVGAPLRLRRSFTSGEKLQKEAPEGRICSGLRHRKGRNRGWRGKSVIFVFIGEGLATFTVAVEAQKPRQEKARLSPVRFKLCQLAAVQSRAGTDFCLFVSSSDSFDCLEIMFSGVTRAMQTQKDFQTPWSLVSHLKSCSPQSCP